MKSSACASTGIASPTMIVPGINSSGTSRNSRNTVVVVANEPMPSVSKKLVTNPMTRSSGVGAAMCSPCAMARLVADRPADDEQHAAGRQRAEQHPYERHVVPPILLAGSRMSADHHSDDSFELYDLRVEVVATDRPMVCGHRAGDWLELRGENLTLPRGPALFHLCAGGAAAAAAGEAADDAPARLDDDRRRDRLSRSPTAAPGSASPASARARSATAR